MLTKAGLPSGQACGTTDGDEPALLIRADAGSMGTGHVMRCLALAHAWQEAGGRAAFALERAPEAVLARLTANEIATYRVTAVPGSAADAAQTVAFANRFGARRVVLDGYHFDLRSQSTVKAADLALLVVDDFGHAAGYVADLVLNQNLHAEASCYGKRDGHTQLLLGPRYALLRREFWHWREETRPTRARARRVLVTLGGTDADNTSAMVIRALRLLDSLGLEVRVVVGPASVHRDALIGDVADAPGTMQLCTDITDMSPLMAWADVAVSAAGSTCWELLFMGVPLVLIELAEHQQAIAESLAEAGVAVNLGGHRQTSEAALAGAVADLLAAPEARREMSERARTVVDGQGARRVAACFSTVGV